MAVRTILTIKHEAAITKTRETEQLRRVAAYCRVSTLQEEQDDSYETQCEYFRRRVAADPTLTLVDVYGDHGISGLSAAKRPEQICLRRCFGVHDRHNTRRLQTRHRIYLQRQIQRVRLCFQNPYRGELKQLRVRIRVASDSSANCDGRINRKILTHRKIK